MDFRAGALGFTAGRYSSSQRFIQQCCFQKLPIKAGNMGNGFFFGACAFTHSMIGA
jgi:hypothetical protein